MRRLRLKPLYAAALALVLPVAASADTKSYGGWQCEAGHSSIDVFYWLTKPATEPGVTIRDSLPTSKLLDSAFIYTADQTSQYFAFDVQFSADYRLVKDNNIIPLNAITVEYANGDKPLAKAKFNSTREAGLINQGAVPLVAAISDPQTKAIAIRLLDGSGKLLAQYSLPTAGFRQAVEAAGAMVGKPGAAQYGKSCT